MEVFPDFAYGYTLHAGLAKLKSEGDRVVGDDIAEDGIKYLQSINAGDVSTSRQLLAAE